MYVRTGFVKAWNEKEDLKGKLEIKKEVYGRAQCAWCNIPAV